MDEMGTAALRAEVEYIDGVAVIKLAGEVDLSTSPIFKQKVYETIEAGSNDVVIVLDELEFMDSTGLGVLVGALKKSRMAGGIIRLVCSKKNIKKVFTITGLDKVFPIYDNLQRCLDD